MFGSGTSTWGQQNNQQQNQQTTGGLLGSSGGFGQQQQNTGGFGQTSTFGQPQQQQNTGGLFGSTSNTNTGFGGGGFGSNQQTQTNAFGSRPAFGATGTSTFGGSAPTTTFGQPQQSGGLFGARPATTSTFGSNNQSTGLFGASSTNTFGASSSNDPNTVYNYAPGPFPQPTNGTAQPPYFPSWQKEGPGPTGMASTGPPHLFHSVSAMEPFRGGSYEELRAMDYQQNRKHPTAQQPSGFGQPATSTFGQTGSTFGQQPAASTSTFGQPKPGGLFGSTTPSTGFGQSSGGFGSTGTTGGLFGQQNNQQTSGGLFGGQQGQQNQTGGLFGQQQTQPQSGGLFGGQSQNTTSGGLFGSTPQNQTNTFGGFGAKPATTGFGSTPGFGQNNTSTFGQQPAATGSTGFSFGQQPQQNSGGLFGSTNTQPSGGLFGQNNQQQPQQQSGGLFGSTAPKPGGLFGSTAPATGTNSFGGFGQNNTTTQPSGGLFGGTNTASSGGLFGQQPAAQPAQSTGGLFGNTNSTFGAKPAQPTTSLFGATQPTQPAQPAQTGSLFGNTASQPAPSFGTGNTFGQNQTQQKPFSFGSSLTNTQPTAQPSTGLFGSLGKSQPAQTNNFGSSSLFSSQAPTQPSGGLFGSTLGQSAASQPTLTASIDQNPYGRNDLFNYTGQKLELTNSTKKPALPPLSSSNFRVTPTKSQLNKLRGFSSPLNTSSPSRVASPLVSPRSTFVSSPAGSDRYKGLSDSALTPNAFVPRPSIKKLTVHKTTTLNGDDPLDSVLGKSALKSSTPRSVASPGSVYNTPANGSSSRRNLHLSGSERQPKHGEYWSRPRLDKLRQLGTGELKALHNLTVGRKGIGEVTFEEPVDLTDIDLNDLFGTVVMFNDMELAVYPDNYPNKPTPGHGLNQPATVTLENCWTKDKASKQPITDVNDPRHARFLKRIKSIPGTEFVSYTDDGMWTFKVEHFSRYGIDEESDEEVDDEPVADVTEESGESGSGSNSEEFFTDESGSDSDDFVPPTRGLHDDDTASETEESPSETEASLLEADLPPFLPPIDKLGAAGARKVKEMQASFFQAPRDTFIDKQAMELKRVQDFDQAGGEPVALERASKRSSFGQPAQLRTARKYRRVEFDKGSVDGSEGVKADAGLGLGRSFRASWGPNGQLVHMGRICGPLSKFAPKPDSTITFEELPGLAIDTRLLKLHLERSDIQLVDGIPVSSFDPSTRFRHFAALFDGDLSHEASIWRLCVALFDEIDLRLPADSDEDLIQRVSEIRRKLALSKWLEYAVASSVDHDLLNATGPEMVFTLLSGHQIERSVQSALDNGDMRLATLVSQIGGPEAFRAEVMRQLDDWRKYKSLIGAPYRRLYALLAGIVDMLPGDKSDANVLVSDNLDWKRAFGLRLWYGNPFEDTIGTIFQTYTAQLAAPHAPAKPLPPYIESNEPQDLRMSTEPTDILYGLVKLYSDVGVSLDQVLRARDCSASPLDARLQWHLYMMLRGMQKRDFEDREGDYSATADAITASYAAELETNGLWTWAAFVLLHLETSQGREASLKALLRRHSPASAGDREFLDQLMVPSTWINGAEADRLASEDDRFNEFQALVKAEHYDRAHRVFIKYLGPELIVRSELALLRRLCTQLADREVAEWDYGGKLLLDYVDCVDELPTLLAHVLRAGPDEHGETGRRVTYLSQAISRILSLVPALFPDQDDVQQAAGLAHVLSELHQLAAQVHLAGYIPNPLVSTSVINADRLHLLQMNAFNGFDKMLERLPAAA